MMRLQRWYYSGGRPNRVVRFLNRWGAAAFARGIAEVHLVTPEMPGRRSGRIVVLPLVMAVVDGERYLVSMLGKQANWVKNVEPVPRVPGRSEKHGMSTPNKMLHRTRARALHSRRRFSPRVAVRELRG